MIDEVKHNSEPSFDAGVQQVAAIYAKALLGATQKAGNSAAVIEELDAVVELLKAQPRFGEVLSSKLIGEDDRNAVIDRVFATRFSATLVDFLRVVSKRGRLNVLRAIHQQVHRQYDVLRGIVRVGVRTAAPLSPASAEQLTQSLRGLVAGEPQIEATVDPDLIGGAIVRVGDTVYDGSVARQLEQLRQQMINRSVHEIQSRRDRFRHPGGN